MPAYASKGELITYITSKGFRKSRIVSMAQINGGIYYRLENGDYIKTTPLGFVKTYESNDLLKLFGETHEGKTEQ